MKKVMLFISLLCSFQVFSGPIDLNDWSQQGPGGNGIWTVSGDGSSVFQSTNGNPTYYVSDDSFINSLFQGSFGVETTSDDDFIGFVFGFSSLSDYYLFDWKQGTQSHTGLAQEGFTLSKISGANVNFWDHSGSDITVLDTSYSSSSGWADNVVYGFTLGYTNSSITISIDGGTFDDESIFDINGLTNSAGQFGFYNYSQSHVRYVGFEEDECTEACGGGGGSEPIPEPSTIIIFSAALIGLILKNRLILH